MVLGDPDVMRFSESGPFTRKQSKDFIEKCLINYRDKGFGLFAVEDKVDHIVIGYCGFYFQLIEGVEEIEIGYRLHPKYWNRGIATETSKAVQEYGFNQLVPRPISFNTYFGNSFYLCNQFQQR